MREELGSPIASYPTLPKSQDISEMYRHLPDAPNVAK